MTAKLVKITNIICGVLLFVSCSTTKHVPEGDQLFVGLTKIDYVDKPDKQYSKHYDAVQAEVEAALATAPNGALFGSSYYRTPFPYGLWIWNYAYGSSGKFKQWLNRSFGKAPVLMSHVNPALRASVAQSVLRNNGYMHSDVTYTEVPQKNKKKMKIGYTVCMDTLFTIDSIEYTKFPAPMKALIDSTQNDSKLWRGAPFAVSSLDAERNRLYTLFRNNGYYYYQPNYASYLADTLATPCHARLRLQLADSLPQESLRKWYVGNISITLRRTMREELTDSMGRRFLKIFYSGKRPPIRPRVLLRDMKLRPRKAFSYDDYQESMQKINATGVFSQTDFQFTPRQSLSSTNPPLSTLHSPLSSTNDTIDLNLSCTLDKPYDFYVETNFINRTIGRRGPEVKVGFTRRNAFRGAEKLDVNLHGAYEWQSSTNDDNMNSYQYGADASIEFPRIIVPFVTERVKRGKDGKVKRPRQFYSTPWTIAKVSTDIVRRPSYYKMHIVSGEWTYRWQPSMTSRHEFSPITLKYQYMNSHTDAFEELVSNNLYLMASMDDYFIPKMRYTYTYASPSKNLNPIRWETTLEESGNATALYDVLVQGHSWQQKDKTLFKNPYSQFLKMETDFTKTWRIDQNQQVVGHLNAGYLHFYGNSSGMPFTESFYVGGANSIRAFTVRSIGPGNFNAVNSREFSYLMQNGNLKFVANLEYRGRLFGNLYGAVFFDAGNVWTTDEPYRMSYDEIGLTEEDMKVVDTWNELYADTRLHPSQFFRQLATGTGVGLRYDLDFLVVRVDWGFGLHVPYQTSKSGYLNIERFRDMHSLHLAIGYPF